MIRTGGSSPCADPRKNMIASANGLGATISSLISSTAMSCVVRASSVF
jgi:hypothetical protein